MSMSEKVEASAHDIQELIECMYQQMYYYNNKGIHSTLEIYRLKHLSKLPGT